MDCDAFRLRLNEFICGESSSQDEEAALEHAASCDACRAVLWEKAESSGSAERFLQYVGLSDAPGPECPSPEDLSAYVAGCCDSALAQRATEHIRECRFCAREVAQLQSFHDQATGAEPVVYAPGALKLKDRTDVLIVTGARLRRAGAIVAAAAVLLIAAVVIITWPRTSPLAEEARHLVGFAAELEKSGFVPVAAAISDVTITRGVEPVQLIRWRADEDTYVLEMDLSSTGWHPKDVMCCAWDVTHAKGPIYPDTAVREEALRGPDHDSPIKVVDDVVKWPVSLRPARIYVWAVQSETTQDAQEGFENEWRAGFIATDITHLLGKSPGEPDLLLAVSFYERAGFEEKAGAIIDELAEIRPTLAHKLKTRLNQ